MSGITGIAKAIAAALAPLALPALHYVGLTEISLTGLEVAIMGLFNMALVYLVPNKA